MEWLHWFAGTFEIEIVCADVPTLISAINSAGISLYHVQQMDALTVRAQIVRYELTHLQKIAVKYGCTVRVLAKNGIYWVVKRLLNRPVLVAGFMMILVLAAYLPGKVFFVYVEGNDKLPARLIIEKAEQCGVAFGANRRLVRSEAVKNQLLAALPQLQWAGVNTYGCTAVISVVERSQMGLQNDPVTVGSIVASQDGIVESIVVTKGTALCKTGQAVKAGQLLVSGYTDCGIMIRATQAEAEVYAQTKRQLSVISPVSYRNKGAISSVSNQIGIKIGKNKINFFKDSGILDATCDKMYVEYNLSLPGGFKMPIAVTVQTVITYEDTVSTVTLEESSEYVEEYAATYLNKHMIGGKILSGSVNTGISGDVFYLHGEYACREMIGQIQKEEIIRYNGKTD